MGCRGRRSQQVALWDRKPGQGPLRSPCRCIPVPWVCSPPLLLARVVAKDPAPGSLCSPAGPHTKSLGPSWGLLATSPGRGPGPQLGKACRSGPQSCFHSPTVLNPGVVFGDTEPQAGPGMASSPRGTASHLAFSRPLQAQQATRFWKCTCSCGHCPAPPRLCCRVGRRSDVSQDPTFCRPAGLDRWFGACLPPSRDICRDWVRGCC